MENNFENKNLLGLLFPGIIRIYMRPTNRSLFYEANSIFNTSEIFLANLEQGFCSNTEFLRDYQLHGLDSIEIIVEKIGPQYENPIFRKQELERLKTEWPSDLLY